ncbi:cytochrome P450 [Xylaria palmicola]|nr:cytochrome P450 [Xylaria palmicola]
MMPFNALLFVGVSVISVVFLYFFLTPKENYKNGALVWSKLNIQGVPSTGIFPWHRALLRSVFRTQSTVLEGYQRICLALNRPFALPTIWVWDAVIVMPPSLLEVLHRPASEIQASKAQFDTIQMPYMVPDGSIFDKPIHFDVVRKYMMNQKHILSLAPLIYREIDAVFRECWGDSTQWTTVNSWDACDRVITRAATSILIGLPTCRDPAFYEPARLFADSIMAGTIGINCLPPILRRIVGPVVALPARYYHAQCIKILVPFVKTRIHIWEARGKGEGVPDDYLQWLIQKCSKEDPVEMNPIRLASRLLMLNSMFVIGMAYVFAHCVEDIYGSPNHKEFIQGMEAECKQVYSEHGGLVTKGAIDSLHRVDSAIRESMRFSDSVITALARDVVSEDLDLGNGIKLPQGSRIVFPTQAIHRDPKNYPDPSRFDAFRFSRRFEVDSHTKPATWTGEREEMVSTSSSFLAFGYGKNSCPGRYFSSQTMKQALAYLLLNYDVEMGKPLSKRRVCLNMVVPRKNVYLKIRRKL